jgi:hypothetical protein
MTTKIAFNPQDRFVVTIGNTMIVTTQNGDVFGADVSGRHIDDIFKFTGSKMAFNPQDRFVVTIGNTMIVTTQNGDAFDADVSGRHIDQIFLLNPKASNPAIHLADEGFQVSGGGSSFTPNDEVQILFRYNVESDQVSISDLWSPRWTRTESSRARRLSSNPARSSSPSGLPMSAPTSSRKPFCGAVHE